MPLIRGLRSVLNRGQDTRSYTYQCLLCNEQFVTEESHMAEVSCPGCGASNVRSVADGA